MNSQIQAAAGSPIWQVAFVSFAVVLVLFEIVRGWRRGVARQFARLCALVAAYFAALFGGRLVVPLVRPFLKMPDAILSILAGAVLGLVVYAVINGLGTVLFKRTSQHASALVRLLYGLSGAALGIFFGAFLVWLIVIGVRSTGAVAEAQVREQAVTSNIVHTADIRRRFVDRPVDESTPLLTSLARLKNSLEMGVVGDAVKKTDFIPAKTYDTLGKVGEVFSNPHVAERLLSFPGARELSEHPKIVALRNDRQIADMIQQGRIVDLLRDPRIIDAANDPTLVEQIKKFDLNAALDYAIEK